MRQFILVALVTILLAGESYCLITTQSEYTHARAKAISNEISATILELSANLRNGEVEQFSKTRERYSAQLEEFGKYADGSNVYERLKSYKDWLELPETEKLLNLNAQLSEYNAKSKSAENIQGQLELITELKNNVDYSGTISEDLAKLQSVTEKIRDCASYCFVEDYDSLTQEYSELQAKIAADFEKINSENEARLQSVQLIESLDEF